MALTFYSGCLQNQIDDIQEVVDISLSAAGWEGSEAPFSQTVSDSRIKETSNPELYSSVISSMSQSEQGSYIQAYGIISQGCAETADESVTFYVWKKPVTDITVRLKGV